MSLHLETPLIESRPLSLVTERAVWLKMEALQAPGSFKIRGVGYACQRYAEEGAQRFVSSSGGNAGLAVAYAGRKLGVAVTVVVPETVTERAMHLLRMENAEVIVHGASWQEANAYAMSLLGPKDAFLHPFDDPLLWQGHATLVDEVAESGFRPDAVVLSVGGGGLMCGVAEGLHRNGWQDIPLVCVETEGAASLNAALEAGGPVALESIKSIATSLGAKRVCDKALEWARVHDVRSATVTDADALAACERFLEDHRVLVEPACGASLALAYENAPVLAGFKAPLFVVCGGATASLVQMLEWKRSFA